MNELVVSETQLMAFIGQYLWPMIRISGFYFMVPVIGARTVPARIRIILTLFTTLLIVPLLPAAPAVSLVSVEAMMMLVKELLIGVALGFMLQVVMHVFVLAGQYIALKMGLGFAAMNDPSSGVSVTVLSQFYLLLSTLLFLSINGHAIVIQLLVDSYDDADGRFRFNLRQFCADCEYGFLDVQRCAGDCLATIYVAVDC